MNADAKTQKLLYVSNGGAGNVRIYGYPGGKPEGMLTGLGDPAGVCTDATGNVWVVESAASKVVEYGHDAKKPKATLVVSGALNLLGCAVDPASGNLAVTDLGNQSGGGGAWVFKNATGSAKSYSLAKIAHGYFAGYDGAGNLFFDGLDTGDAFHLAELAAGSSTPQLVSLNQSIGFPGGVQWDGTYLTVGDQTAGGKHLSAVYQFSIAGSSGSLQATIALPQSCAVLQFAISGATLVAPDACQNNAKFYAYPAGGQPTKTIGGFAYPVAAAVSVPGGSDATSFYYRGSKATSATATSAR